MGHHGLFRRLIFSLLLTAAPAVRTGDHHSHDRSQQVVVAPWSSSFGVLPEQHTLRPVVLEIDNFVAEAHRRASVLLGKNTTTKVHLHQHPCTLDKLREIIHSRFSVALQEESGTNIKNWSDAHTVSKFMRDRAFRIDDRRDLEGETNISGSECVEFLTLIRRRLFWGLLREWRVDLDRLERLSVSTTARGVGDENDGKDNLWRNKSWSKLNWSSHTPQLGQGGMPAKGGYATDGIVVFRLSQ